MESIHPPTYHQLEAKARELGFAHVGLLTLPDLDSHGRKLKSWLDRGFHGDMAWMVEHLDKRLDPFSLLPGARSILCVTLNYYPGEIPEDAPAKIARYAQGDDYHELIRKRLKTLLQWLQSFDSRIEGRPLTDSAPVMERSLAVQAGLGWIGKNGNLISRDVGSWLFLGELLLNVTFEDAPNPVMSADFCGTCRRCLDACPTDAFVEPKTIDSTKCIAYWTIESDVEQLPKPIADNLEGWLFGCDICQEVCPWNIKFQQPSADEAFAPRPWNRNPRLAEILSMPPEQFRLRFRKSTIKRTGLKNLQRNANTLLERIKVKPVQTDVSEGS